MPYANVFRPMGFKLHAESGKKHPFAVPRPVAAVRTPNNGGNASFDIAIGDAYSLDNNGNAFRSGPGDIVRGVVAAFRFLAVTTIMNSNGPVSQDYLPNGSVGTILGWEDPDCTFEVQADTYANASAGERINLVDAAPDSTLSQSRQSVTVAAAGTQFLVIGPIDSLADNVVGTNARVYVKLATTFLE